MDQEHSHKGLDAFNRPRLGGIAEMLAPEIEARTGIESRSVALGHLQRGGVPSAYDRVLATRLGMHAVDAVEAGQWGTMVALRGTDIVHVTIAEATGGLNKVPHARYEEAAVLFG
jgi:6-phosphofructokinase